MKAYLKFGLLLSLAILTLPLVGSSTRASAQEPEGGIVILAVDGQITSITQRYITREIKNAEKGGSQLVLIRLDTPGGLLSATEKIVQALLNAKVATAVYVFPQGAFAASAGTFITAAANFAVMSEGSSIGAATPVGAGGEDLPATLSTKAKNIAVAMIEGIADKRGRNKEKLISTVTEAKAFSARQAVAEGIVDFIARDLDDLLAQLDGKTAETATGTLTLNTTSAPRTYVGMSFSDRFLSIVANPNLVLILLALGALGIFVEILSPGLVIPGVVGGIALVLGLVGLGSLPFNWAGVVLLALAAALIFFEIHTPGLGFLGASGVVAFVLGALLLFTVDIPSLPGAPIRTISLWLLGVLSAIMAAFALIVVTAAVGSRRLKYPAFEASLVGTIGEATSDLAPQGTVQVGSELWSAISEEGNIQAGEKVHVVSLEGLTLRVQRLKKGG